MRLVLLAVTNHGPAIRYASSELRADHDLGYLAVSTRWQTLEHLPEELRIDPIIMKKALAVHDGQGVHIAAPHLLCCPHFIDELIGELGQNRMRKCYIMRVTMLSGRSCMVVADFHDNVIERRLDMRYVLRICTDKLGLSTPDVSEAELILGQTPITVDHGQVNEWKGLKNCLAKDHVNDLTLVLRTQ
mmetsp:Transcript_7760/g.10774  ORF Transcript_7760/g.10774 Transcript_7760/m.10774 type:complete len:188 (-) Transcript_7760:135-698(-)